MAKILAMATRGGSRVPEAPTRASDDELMLLARAGDREAFDALVRRHQGRALRIAARYVGETAARDAAQAAFLELYRAVPTYRPRGTFSAYLNRIVVNQCRMLFRADRSRQSALSRFQQKEPTPPPTSRDQMLARERQRDVERAVALLSRKLREVVVLRFAGELSYQEIADTLEIPIGTVKSRLFTGLEKLARDLEGSRITEGER